MSQARFVRGEMYDWTDYDSNNNPAVGDGVAVLLDELISSGDDVALIGPHPIEISERIVAKSAKLTLLVRGATDAEMLAERLPEATVVGGGLAGFSGEFGDSFSVILALDGLDRLSSNDEDPITWADKLSQIHRCLKSDGTLVVTVTPPVRATDVLDSRPEHLRHGDDEFVPLYSDQTRPDTIAEFAASLNTEPESCWLGFGSAQLSNVLIRSGVKVTSPLLDRAIAATYGAHRFWVASPDELMERSNRAGALALVADFWLAIAGGKNARLPDAVVKTRNGTQLAGSLVNGEWSVDERSFPLSDSVGFQLVRLLESGDLPQVRVILDHLQTWLQGRGPGSPIRLDQLVATQDGFFPAWVALDGEYQPEVLLGAAWRAFLKQVHRNHLRQPWPTWVQDEQMFQEVMPDTPEASEEITQLADRLESESEAEVLVVNLRREAADYEELQYKLFEAKGEVAALARLIQMRDEQLRSLESNSDVGDPHSSLLSRARRHLRGQELTRLVRRASDASSVDEVTAGLRRVVRRIRRG